MSKLVETDVLVIGEGCGGMAAALSAHEKGARVTLLYNGKASSTAISTGFVTYAAHEGFTRDEVLAAMSNITGKGICDMALLRRLVSEGPMEIAAAIERYGIPIDQAPRGIRVRRSAGERGVDLLGGDYGLDGAKDMTGLMMEFSSTHGTALFSQLRKSVKASDIERLKGTAFSLTEDGLGAWALVDGETVKIAAGAVIVATGGMQGVYAFTDTPKNLLGDGQSMALEAGADLIDMEFIQFYPLAVNEEGIPAIFLYPDYPDTARLVNADGEDLIEKHLGADVTSLGALHNWDELSFIIQKEIVHGKDVFIDFRATKDSEWKPDSLTATFLSGYIPNFRDRPIRIAPSSHYTIGGIRVDINGQTTIPHIYAVGEVAGGIHGANRHGGTALAEAITFGRIAGRHAVETMRHQPSARQLDDAPPARRSGRIARVSECLDEIREINQRALGPYRTEKHLSEAAAPIADLAAEVETFGWNDLEQYGEVLQLKRVIRLSEIMRQAMLRRTESRGTHTRADFPEMDENWVRKQIVRLTRDGSIDFEDEPLLANSA